MYIVTRFGYLVSYQGEYLEEFLYSAFDFKIENGKVYIRPHDYKVYAKYDEETYDVCPTSWNKQYTNTEIVKDYIDSFFKKYAKQFDYQIYKIVEE